MILKSIKLMILLFALASCSSNQEGGRSGGAGRVKPYVVTALTPQSSIFYKEYPTTLQGVQTVEIRSRIAAYIDEILVDEGDVVTKGQLLFRLNNNDIKATVRSGEAQVKVAQAQVANAKINLAKIEPLVKKEIVSNFELEASKVALLSSEAQLSQAQANLANVKANLDYTLVTSPANGVIGTFPYRVGSLVSSASAQPLTSVSNTAEMYAYFSMNEKEFFTLANSLSGATIQQKLSNMPMVNLILPDNSIYRQLGVIETASGLVDQATGAVNIRTKFSNADGLLRSGGSGSIRISTHADSVVIIPQKATFELQGKYFVFVVDSSNVVHSTEIEVFAGNLKSNYVVTKGLKFGDKIVAEGIASLRDGLTIEPQLKEAVSLTEKNASAAPHSN